MDQQIQELRRMEGRSQCAAVNKAQWGFVTVINWPLSSLFNGATLRRHGEDRPWDPYKWAFVA